MTNKNAAFLPIGIGMGVSVGVALGVALDNVGLGLALGTAIGSGFGVALMGAANMKAKKGGGSDGGAVMPPSDTSQPSGSDCSADSGRDGVRNGRGFRYRVCIASRTARAARSVSASGS